MKRASFKLIGAVAVSLGAAGAAKATVDAAPPPDASKPASSATPAAAVDIKAGAPLRDVNGAPAGTIVSGTDQQVVVDTGQTKIGVPLNLFRKDEKGVLLSITAQQFNDAIAKAHARSQAQQQQQPSQPQESH